MSKSQSSYWFLLAVLFVLGVSLGIYIYKEDQQLLEQVKNGNYTLTCFLQSGTNKIDPDKVVDRIDGYWIFTNGQAKNCEIKKVRNVNK